MIVFAAIYLMLPAYLANMMPVFLAKILKDRFDYPVDFGLKIKGIRVFGDHKTWRGLIGGVLAGILMAWIQKLLLAVPFFINISVLPYYKHWLLIGFALGFGALFGDLVKSFFKRRVKLKPGQSWAPFDQIDFTLGSLIMINIFFHINPFIIVIALILSPLFHPLANFLGYVLKIKKNKW